MLQLSKAGELRQFLSEWREAKNTIALVPTMGNLHAGHLSLVELAEKLADKIIVSIFVNPTQFSANEDYEIYPRTLQKDIEQLADTRVELVFTPDTYELYPSGLDMATRVTVPELDNILCGVYRPGHFSGVATVANKLFNLLQPDVAVFGQKDLQQLRVIQRMVTELCMPIKIVKAPTIREPDGLALSSRNNYLSQAERTVAVQLYQVLRFVSESILGGDKRFKALEDEAVQRLQKSGFKPDYVAIRDAVSLGEARKAELVILAAAYLGKTRLIDNLFVSVQKTW